MLFTTDGQMLVAFIFLLLSLILCTLSALLYFIVKKFIKNEKFKFAIFLVLDFIVVVLFAFGFIYTCTKCNYGLVRWFEVFAYLLPIVLFLYVSKKQRIKKLENLQNWKILIIENLLL